MKPIIFYDTETTGLPDWKSPSDSEHQPHLVQLGAILADSETREVVSTLDLVIRPDTWDIPKEVSDIHGITNEMATAFGVPEAQATQLFLSMWNKCDRVAHNKTFDQRLLRIAIKRYFGADESLQEQWAEKDNHFCTMAMSKPIMQLLPKGRWGYKSPKLEEAYKHFTGNELVGAHSAIVDARACMEVYWAIKDLENDQ